MRNLLSISGLLIFLICSCASPENQSQKEDSEGLKTEKINYKIHKQWEIPNGGFGRVIVIDSSKRNEIDLKQLGETLKYDTRLDRNAFVFVYDDVKAAELRDNLSNLNKKDESFHGKHFIATYTKNINSGYHKLEIMIDGIDGEWKTISY
jgi:hypothetical protein